MINLRLPWAISVKTRTEKAFYHNINCNLQKGSRYLPPLCSEISCYARTHQLDTKHNTQVTTQPNTHTNTPNTSHTTKYEIVELFISICDVVWTFNRLDVVGVDVPLCFDLD